MSKEESWGIVVCPLSVVRCQLCVDCYSERCSTDNGQLTTDNGPDNGSRTTAGIAGSVQDRDAELGVCGHGDAVWEIFAAGGGVDDRGEACRRGDGAQVRGMLPDG